MNAVKQQKTTDNYAVYNSDCMLVLPTLPSESIDLCIYSPPFAGLYNYSSSENDFSNCESKEQFLTPYTAQTFTIIVRSFGTFLMR